MKNSKEKLIDNHKKLRPYQKEGVNFFVNNDHCLMADEMGLGKTVQTSVAIDVLLHEKKLDSILIICPAALTYNWFRELDVWCPSVSKTIIKGGASQRKALYMLPFNIWIASYEQIRIDMNQFISLDLHFDLVVLDEAQRIKNKDSKTSLSTKLISRKKSWALSGTPVENNIEDLVSIFSFLNSNVISEFNSLNEIKRKIRPHFLRRTKKEVLKELPPILYQDLYLELNKSQMESYDNEMFSVMNDVNLKSEMGKLFSIITKLKQICNFDPHSNQSSKYEALSNIIVKAIANKKKILVFSQYVETLKFLKEKVELDFNLNPDIFHGGISKDRRDKIIFNFEKSIGFNLLFISLKAGGVGLNLNSASIVVMFDRWWNPAVEDQAIQRAHRFGKKEPLNVFRFLIVDSIEEKIDKILKEKKELFDRVIGDADIAKTKLFNKHELLRLLKNNS